MVSMMIQFPMILIMLMDKVILTTIFHSVNDDTIPYDLDDDKGQGINQINIHDINDTLTMLMEKEVMILI